LDETRSAFSASSSELSGSDSAPFVEAVPQPKSLATARARITSSERVVPRRVEQKPGANGNYLKLLEINPRVSLI
jgi:hypothetical protein